PDIRSTLNTEPSVIARQGLLDGSSGDSSIKSKGRTSFCWSRNSAAACGREAKFGCDAHLGLAVRNCEIWRLDRETGRRLDHRAVLLDLRRCFGPERIGAAVGGKCGAIEIGEKPQRRKLTNETVPLLLRERSKLRRTFRNIRLG